MVDLTEERTRLRQHSRAIGLERAVGLDRDGHWLLIQSGFKAVHTLRHLSVTRDHSWCEVEGTLGLTRMAVLRVPRLAFVVVEVLARVGVGLLGAGAKLAEVSHSLVVVAAAATGL